MMGEKKRKAAEGGLTMHMPNLSLEERIARAKAANAAADTARAAGVEPNAWLREQFASDLVWGVWQDADAPGGIGVGLLRGYGKLMLISQGTRGKAMTDASIRCGSLEEAEAMCRTFGDGRAQAA